MTDFRLLFGESKEIDAILRSVAKDALADPKRGRVTVNYDDAGNGYLRGATSADKVLSPYGLTWDDVTIAKRELRAVGIKPRMATKDEVASALCAAVDAILRGVTPTYRRQYPTFAEYARAKRHRRIAKLRDAGICIACGRNYVETHATCYDCGVKANASRDRRKAQQSASVA